MLMSDATATRTHWMPGQLTEGDVEPGEYFWADGRRFLRVGLSTNREVDADGRSVAGFAVVPEERIDRIEGDPVFTEA